MRRIRIKFTKQGLLKFISHRDLMRLIERAARRAELPLALTQGFNPHPRMSFASALPVGSSSLSEYADIILSQPLKPAEFLDRLNKKLPGEVQVLEATEVPMNAPSLARTINRTALYAKEGGNLGHKTDSYRRGRRGNSRGYFRG